MSATDTERVWRLTPGRRLRYRCWGDEHVYYEEGSGDTHLLDAVAARILDLLRQAPMSTAAIRDRVSPTYPDGGPDPASVDDYLAELSRCGLIESRQR